MITTSEPSTANGRGRVYATNARSGQGVWICCRGYKYDPNCMRGETRPIVSNQCMCNHTRCEKCKYKVLKESDFWKCFECSAINLRETEDSGCMRCHLPKLLARRMSQRLLGRTRRNDRK